MTVLFFSSCLRSWPSYHDSTVPIPSVGATWAPACGWPPHGSAGPLGLQSGRFVAKYGDTPLFLM